MKTLHAPNWALVGILLLIQTGCHREKTVVVEQQPEPVYVEQQAPPPIVVQEAPPAVIVENRPPQPAGAFVWVGGYWHWDNHRYVWVGGRWAHPPHTRWVLLSRRCHRPPIPRKPRIGSDHCPRPWLS